MAYRGTDLAFSFGYTNHNFVEIMKLNKTKAKMTILGCGAV
jgi:hypothetical protein